MVVDQFDSYGIRFVKNKKVIIFRSKEDDGSVRCGPRYY